MIAGDVAAVALESPPSTAAAAAPNGTGGGAVGFCGVAASSLSRSSRTLMRVLPRAGRLPCVDITGQPRTLSFLACFCVSGNTKEKGALFACLLAADAIGKLNEAKTLVATHRNEVDRRCRRQTDKQTETHHITLAATDSNSNKHALKKQQQTRQLRCQATMTKPRQ